MIYKDGDFSLPLSKYSPKLIIVAEFDEDHGL
jgi:hypothetical protein